MKKTIILIILALTMAVAAQAKPLVYFDKTVHNFGRIKPDTSHSAVFVFHNRGTSTLVIERVRAG